MSNPYKFRICAALPGHDPVELFRSNISFQWKVWRFWTSDMSPEWECWSEYPLTDRQCITDRPRSVPAKSHHKNKLHLEPEDKRRIGVW